MALAIERTQECNVLVGRRFERPILDMGCGDGVFASVLFREPIDTGVDADPRETGKAARLGAYTEVIACGGNEVPREQGKFRTVFSNSVLEHIEELPAVLKEVHRLLAAGGHFYVTVPTDQFERFSVLSRVLEWLGLKRLAIRYRAFFNRFWKHLNVSTVAGWQEVFERAGFRVLEARTYHPGPLSTLCDFLVPFAVLSLVSKKALGRWIVFPALRRVFARLLGKVIASHVDQLGRRDGGVLVFFDLVPA